MSILYDFKKSVHTAKILIPWKSGMTEITPGTPFDKNGEIANGSGCKGLLLNKLTRYANSKLYPDGKYYAEAEILTGGYVDIVAAEKISGITYSSDMKAALENIVFVKGNLPEPTIPKELPTVTAADNGKVLTVVAGKWEAASLPEDNTENE